MGYMMGIRSDGTISMKGWTTGCWTIIRDLARVARVVGMAGGATMREVGLDAKTKWMPVEILQSFS